MNRQRDLLALIPFALFLGVLPFPGTVAARLLLLVACFGFALWQWRTIPEARAPIPNKIAIAFWIAVCLVSVPLSVDPLYSLREVKNEIGYTMATFFAFFTVFRNPNSVRGLFRFLCGAALLVGTLSVWSWARAGFHWQDGFIGGSGVVATYVVTIFPCLVWMAATEESAVWRGTARAVLFLTLLLGAITVQRAIWPALTVEASIMFVLAARTKAFHCGRWGIAFALVFIMAAGIGGTIGSQYVRFSPSGADAMELFAGTADPRLNFWAKFFTLITDHPFVGAGFGRHAMRKAYPEVFTSEFIATTQLWHAHNIVLNYGGSMGFPGILALVGVFGGFGLLFWRATSGAAPWAGIAGLAMLLGVLLRNQTNDFFIRDMSLLFWALTGVFSRIAIETAKERKQ